MPTNLAPATALLASERQALAQTIANTRANYAQNGVSQLVPQSYATVVSSPDPTAVNDGSNSPVTAVALAILIGLLLAVGVPVIIDRLDHTIRDARSAGKSLSARVLSTIPATHRRDGGAIAEAGSARDDAYQALAATSVATDHLPRAIVVTAPVGEMQDEVAANFAVALAGLGLAVALVATDPRQAWFAESVGAVNAPTLPDLLALARRGQLNGQIGASLVPSRFANLALLAPGTTEVTDLLDGLPTLLQGLVSSGIDVTVIAAPALLASPAATIFAWSTRSILWVVEAGEVTDQEAREAAIRLELAGGTPFGVAMVTSTS